MGHAKRWHGQNRPIWPNSIISFYCFLSVCKSQQRFISLGIFQMPATASESSFVLNCRQKMTHLINSSDKGGSNVEDSTKIHWLRPYLNTSLRAIISNTTAVLYFNVVLRSLNMMKKADYLILGILSETTAKPIVQKYIICKQLMSFYQFLS